MMAAADVRGKSFHPLGGEHLSILKNDFSELGTLRTFKKKYVLQAEPGPQQVNGLTNGAIFEFQIFNFGC